MKKRTLLLTAALLAALCAAAVAFIPAALADDGDAEEQARRARFLKRMETEGRG